MSKVCGGVIAALLVMVVFMVEAEPVCMPTLLLPCLGPISGGTEPSAECCNRLKEQQPCFCDYIKNPQFKPYIDSPNARKVAATCGITIPTC